MFGSQSVEIIRNNPCATICAIRAPTLRDILAVSEFMGRGQAPDTAISLSHAWLRILLKLLMLLGESMP